MAQLSISRRLIRSLSDYWRAQRLRAFLEYMRPPAGATILDLGGTDVLWQTFDHDYRVTLVNLPGGFDHRLDDSRFRYVEADATSLGDRFEEGSFDVVYSNSVIEHVGDRSKQRAFANEVRRLGRSYWVQTPSDRAPLEPHTMIPFYWKLPLGVRDMMNDRWKRRLPAWQEMVAGTTVLSRAWMEELFPEGRVYVETVAGFEKSYSLYKPLGVRASKAA